MTNKIGIIGAGGFAREVLDIFSSRDLVSQFSGFYSENADFEHISGYEVFSLEKFDVKESSYIIAIGDGDARRRIAQNLGPSCAVTGIAHESSTQGSTNIFGDGFVLAAGSRVTTNVRVGTHFHLNLNSTIGHDCIIGDFVTVFPGVNVSGNVTIGSMVTLGTGSTVLPGISIGEGAFVGAGAVVTKDVAPGTTVVGIPAR